MTMPHCRARSVHSTESENHSLSREIAMWTGAAAHQAKAIVVYNKLSPGYHYRVRSDPKKIIKGFKTFKDKELEFGKQGSTGNPTGRIEFRRFGFEDIQCVGFTEYWGSSGGETTSVGTRLMYGYYCADPGQALADEAITAVVKGLDVKSKAMVRPAHSSSSWPISSARAVPPESKNSPPAYRPCRERSCPRCFFLI